MKRSQKVAPKSVKKCYSQQLEKGEPMHEVVTIIQARTGSTRLPGKVLLPLGPSTVLGQMLIRLQASQRIGKLVVATTHAPEDDAIVDLCDRMEVASVRGHGTDVLARHLTALEAYPAEIVVKIPSDCPLIDPAIIDEVIGFYQNHPNQFDYVSNLHPQSYPDGNDVEVIRPRALITAAEKSTRAIDREHTTPYLWDNPQLFRLGNVRWPRGIDLSAEFRWTLDYLADYKLITAIFDSLWPQHPLFSVDDIVQLLQSKPEIRSLNRQYLGDSWYMRHQNELQTACST